MVAGDTIDAVGIGLYEHLYTSTNGNEWFKITGPITIYDFLVHNNLLVIATHNGVVTHNLNTGEETFGKFLETNSIDIVKQVVVNEVGEFFAATHDGIYRSSDEGQSWTRVTEEIHKDDDKVDKIFIVDDFNMYTFGKNILHSADNGENWEIVNFEMEDVQNDRIRNFSANDLEISSDLMIYSISSLGFYVAEINRTDLFKYSGPPIHNSSTTHFFDYEEIYQFNNGSVLISNWRNISFKVSIKNQNSIFWK